MSFDWNKVSFDIDLWITEMSLNNKFDEQSAELILDQGIPIEPFEKLTLSSIKENEDSATHVGLRISDVLVVITGKYMSKLANELRYDKNKPEERTLLPHAWFQLEEKQFDLLKKMNTFLFPNDSIYCFIVDTYFDDALQFETYIRYISSYESFNDYNEQIETHVHKHFMYLAEAMMSKWNNSIENESQIRSLYGNMNAGIKSGNIRSI